MGVVGVVFGILAIGLVIAAIIMLLLRQKPKMIFGKYPSKGVCYYFKYRLALLVLKHLRGKLYPDDGTDNFEKFDKPQPLTNNPQSYDVVSFMAANDKGQKLMVTLERRRRGVMKACLYLWLPDQGLYCSPNLPDMVYFTTNGKQENEEFRGAGFHIFPEECMRNWRVHYEGQLRNVATEKLSTVEIYLQFSSKQSYFNYNRDLSASVIADSVAREAWDDSFFGMIKRVDQVLARRIHYEQSGVIEGTVKIEDRKLELSLKGFRDHSFGTERCLSTINRYVYFALFLDDGTCMVVGNLSQPTFFLSSLKVGYICTPDGKYQPITSCNFELYSYGEKGTPPKHPNFIVKTETTKYLVQIEAEDTAIRYMGGEWQSKIFNQFVSCTVNGIKGQGLTEYLYRYQGGRPHTVSSSDPEWYQKIKKYERTLSTGEARDDDDEVFIF